MSAAQSSADIAKWTMLQQQLSQQVIEKDDFKEFKYVAGVDISFFKDDEAKKLGFDAITALVVLEYPNVGKLVYSKVVPTKLTMPYVSGFLAFREAEPCQQLLQELQKTHPDIYNSMLLFIDGNGIMHPKYCGLASHLGVTLNLPVVGVAKKMISVDGLHHDIVEKECLAKLTKKGEYSELRGNTGRLLGAALKFKDVAKRLLYVSVGHRISLPTAVRMATACYIHGDTIEPVRQADLTGRDEVRRLMATLKP